MVNEEANLHNIITEELLHIVFQPIISLKNAEVFRLRSICPFNDG